MSLGIWAGNTIYKTEFLHILPKNSTINPQYQQVELKLACKNTTINTTIHQMTKKHPKNDPKPQK